MQRYDCYTTNKGEALSKTKAVAAPTILESKNLVEHEVSQADINSAKQNKVSYVVDDVLKYIKTNDKGTKSEDDVRNDIYEILLKRGVFKWFANRRKLIGLKNHVKKLITRTTLKQTKIKEALSLIWDADKPLPLESAKVVEKKAKISAKKRKLLAALGTGRGALEVMNGVLKEMRTICHSDRCSVQDNDKAAQVWLFRTLNTKCVECPVNEKECSVANIEWDIFTQQHISVNSVSNMLGYMLSNKKLDKCTNKE
jgi:hypothetical protein